WPVEVADTAGWRSHSEPLEQAGIALARDAAAEADLCLWVLDASASPVFPPGGVRAQYVINKIDLPSAWDVESVASAIRVSAKTGAGIDRLCEIMSQKLVPMPPPPAAAVPFTLAIIERLRQAQRECADGRWSTALALLQQQ